MPCDNSCPAAGGCSAVGAGFAVGCGHLSGKVLYFPALCCPPRPCCGPGWILLLASPAAVGCSECPRLQVSPGKAQQHITCSVPALTQTGGDQKALSYMGIPGTGPAWHTSCGLLAHVTQGK